MQSSSRPRLCARFQPYGTLLRERCSEQRCVARVVVRAGCRSGRHTRLRSPLRVVCTYSRSMARGGGAVSDLAHLPRGLLSLEQWDALELDPTRRWELSEVTLIMSPRPDLWHQRISKRLTRLLDDHLPDELEAVPEIEAITRALFPPSVRDPDIVVVPARVFERRPTRSLRRTSCSSWRSSRRARAEPIT